LNENDKQNNMESEGDSPSVISVTTQAQRGTHRYHLLCMLAKHKRELTEAVDGVRSEIHSPAVPISSHNTLGHRKPGSSLATTCGRTSEDVVATKLVESLGLRVRIPPGAWMSVLYDYYALSRRGLCDRPIARPHKSYRLCMWVCHWVWSGAPVRLYIHKRSN